MMAFLFFWTGMAAGHGTEDKSLISPAMLADDLITFQVIDLRSLAEFKKGHISSASPIPLVELSLQKLQSAGITPERPVVLYASSTSQPKKAKLLLEIMGYSNIRILAGGITHWIEDGNAIDVGYEAKDSVPDEQRETNNLEVFPESNDFGVIAQKSSVVVTTFAVKNTGSETVFVEEITTSCGCTSAHMEEREILPRSSNQVIVNFDPDYHKEPQGRFSRTVFLQMSSGQELQFKLFVEISTD
jgi:rhodanese-related sulfurtransferase